jgi:hypothetical protein
MPATAAGSGTLVRKDSLQHAALTSLSFMLGRDRERASGRLPAYITSRSSRTLGRETCSWTWRREEASDSGPGSSDLSFGLDAGYIHSSLPPLRPRPAFFHHLGESSSLQFPAAICSLPSYSVGRETFPTALAPSRQEVLRCVMAGVQLIGLSLQS